MTLVSTTQCVGFGPVPTKRIGVTVQEKGYGIRKFRVYVVQKRFKRTTECKVRHHQKVHLGSYLELREEVEIK